MDDAEYYRCRLIYLKPDAARGDQADAACEALAGVDGILLAAPFDAHSIHIVYSLDELSFEIINALLDELGFTLDNSILISLRNTIYGFLDDNARANMNVDDADPAETEENPEIPEAEEKYWEDYR
jgi:hypothetical protein